MGFVATACTVNMGGSEIAMTKVLNWSGLGRDAVETTTFSSPSDCREYVKGLLEPGEITFTANYDMDNATHDATTSGAILDDLLDATIDTITFTYHNAVAVVGTHTVTGFVTNVDLSAEMGGLQEMAVTIKCAGLPTFNA